MNDRVAPLRPAGMAPGLLAALGRLDALLDRCVRDMQSRGMDASAASRALFVSAGEAAALLARGPLTPAFTPFWGAPPPALAGQSACPSPLDMLARWFDLSDFDLDLALIALAPEIDLRYERVYGFLQDDTTRRRASVDLALGLRCISAEDRLARLAHLAPDAPLIRNAVLRLVADPQQGQQPLAAHTLALDPQITAMLLGQRGLDRRLAGWCRLSEVGDRPEPRPADGTVPALLSLARDAARAGRALVLHFQGRRGLGQQASAISLATALGARLLHADLARLPASAAEIEPSLSLACREAWLQGHLLLLDGIDALHELGPQIAPPAGLAAPASRGRIIILAGEQDCPPPPDRDADFVCVPFAAPDLAARREAWRRGLAASGIGLAAAEIDALAARFRLGAERICQAIGAARGQALWRAANGHATASVAADLFAADLFAAGRSLSGRALQSAPGLRSLARRIAPKQGWNDLMLPPEQTAQLREVCGQARLRPVVHDDWGFARRLSGGHGLNVLFTGPPGTGKTLAAEVIAGALRLDLYKIDLSQVVSKYIGETEKNLDRVFTAAEDADAILFFDEADALFGKRSEVKDAHDRYANIEIGYLLQKMEEYAGLAILATNLRQNLDDAFLRRLQAVIEFPFPDEMQRRRIWEITFPPEAPLGGSVDFAALARAVRLPGGSIRNIALAAAFQAAAGDGTIEMAHLAHAARREHEKLGHAWDAGLLGGRECDDQRPQ